MGPDRVETVSVLFTDIVGSTAARTQMGDVAADGIRRLHDRMLNAAVVDAGGAVLKGTGDGILATFHSAAEAVTAAIGIQQAVQRHSQLHPPEAFDVRVGVSAGDVAVEGDDVFGMPVVEAARLCDAAPSGHVLVADVVRVLCGTRSPARFEPVGPLELKGLAEPLIAAEVLWESASTVSDHRLRFPPALSDRTSLPFVGRAAELEHLRTALDAAVAESFGVVLVAGEAGAGKTRLAAEFARRAHDDGAIVLHGRCDEHVDAPFQPFVEALRAVAAAPGGWVEHLPRQVMAELVPLLPELAAVTPVQPSPGVADPESDRFRLMSAVCTALGCLAADVGALLVIDDAQWADRASVQVIRLLLRTQPHGLLLVCTHRDAEADLARPWGDALPELHRCDSVSCLDVGALAEEELAELLAASAGPAAKPADHAPLAALMMQHTEGNAFFLGELLRHLVERGIIRVVDGQWQLTRPDDEWGIPDGIRELVGERVSAVHDCAHEVLSAAAVAGFRFPVGPVAELFSDVELVEEVVDRAIAARLVVEEGVGRCRFTHAFVHAALYGTTSATRRARLHLGLAAVLTQRGADPTVLARHWEAGASLDRTALSNAVRCLVEAGDAAVATDAPDSAIIHYRRALELADGHRDHDVAWFSEVSTRLGAAERQAGDPAYRERLTDVARAALAAELPGAAAAALVETYRGGPTAFGSTNEEIIGLIEETLDRGPAISLPARARLLSLRVSEMFTLGDERRRTEAARQALESARAVEDSVARAEPMAAALSVLAYSDQLECLDDVADELADLCPTLPPRQGVIARRSLLSWATISGQSGARSGRWLHEALMLADELGEPALRCIISAFEIERAVLHGTLDEAMAAVERMILLAELAGDPVLATVGAVHRTQVESYRGRSAIEDLEGTELMLAAMPDLAPMIHCAYAHLLAEAGAVAESAVQLDRAAAADFGGRARVFGYVPGLVRGAQAAVLIASPHRHRLRELLSGCRTVVPSTGMPFDTPAYCLGLIDASFGDHDAAVDDFRAAIEIYDRIEAPVFRCRAEAQLAGSLWARGDRDDAHRHAVRARTAAQRCGAGLPDLSGLWA